MAAAKQIYHISGCHTLFVDNHTVIRMDDGAALGNDVLIAALD